MRKEPYLRGRRGWKPTGKTIGPEKWKNKRTGEVMQIPLQAEERYILRSGKRKGKMIYRYTVVR